MRRFSSEGGDGRSEKNGKNGGDGKSEKDGKTEKRKTDTTTTIKLSYKSFSKDVKARCADMVHIVFRVVGQVFFQ